jgi:hypothetical protein
VTLLITHRNPAAKTLGVTEAQWMVLMLVTKWVTATLGSDYA